MPDDAWLSSLAGFGLPGSAPIGEPLTSVADMLFSASRHKLVGVLAAAVADGAVRLAPDDYSEVARAHEATMREVLLLEEVLLDAVETLDKAGIGSRVLKGAALAHLVHPDASERCFGDNDVLVASRDVDAALAALGDAGAVRATPPLSASFDRRFAKSVTLRWRGPTELDLHRTLAAGPFGLLIDLDDLTRDPVEIILAGRSVRTLPTDLHLLHGAIHVALGDIEARLGNVRDLALLSARPSLGVERVIATAERWGCSAPVAIGLRQTAALGHTRSEIEIWADDFEINSIDAKRLDAYAQRSGRFRRQARASLGVLRWRDRLAFTRAVMLPSAANRAARGWTGRIPPRTKQPD